MKPLWMVLAGVLLGCSGDDATEPMAPDVSSSDVAVTDAAGEVSVSDSAEELVGTVDAAAPDEGPVADAEADVPTSAGYCPTLATTLTVGPAGDHATISAAVAAAGPDTTIVVQAGTYDETVDIDGVAGASESARLVLCAESRHGATITQAGRVLDIREPWVTVKGFVIDGQWGDSDVVRVRDTADHLRLVDLDISKGRRDGIDMGGGDAAGLEDVELRGLVIHRFLAGSTTDQQDAHCIVATDFNGLRIIDTETFYCAGDGLQTGTDRDPWTDVLIDGCHFWAGPLPEDMPGFAAGEVPGENAIDTKHAVYAAPWVGLMTIRNSRFGGFDPQSAYIGNRAALNLKEAITGTVDACEVYGSEVGFRIRGAGSNGGVNGLVVTNTVMHDNQFHVRLEDDCENVSFVHNTFGRLIDADNAPRPLTSDAYASDTLKGGGGGHEGPGWSTQNKLLAGQALSDRAAGSGDALATTLDVWVDAAAGDYHLATDVPAAAGTGVATDKDGNVRDAVAPSAGAHEL